MFGNFEKLIINSIVVIVLIISWVNVKLGVFIVIKNKVIIKLMILFKIIMVSCWCIKIKEILIVIVMIVNIIFNVLNLEICNWCILGSLIWI